MMMTGDAQSNGSQGDSVEFEQFNREQTIQRLLAECDWLTAEQFPPKEGEPVVLEWMRVGRIYCVTYQGKRYFARYQFDHELRPLPVIKRILEAFGNVTDGWVLAAWFHFPNGWLVHRDEDGVAGNVAPCQVLDRGDDVVRAAASRLTSYVA